jgi:hypothetical protein
MLEAVEESTTLKIKSLDKGLTLEMLYNISQIGKVKNIKLDEEGEKLERELRALEKKSSWEEDDWKKSDELKKKIEEAYARSCSGYQFSLDLHIGYAQEYVYYKYMAYRTASEKEVQDIIQKIREICAGVELEIECERYKYDEQLKEPLESSEINAILKHILEENSND